MPTGDNPQELVPRRLPLSPAARERLWCFYEAVEAAQVPGSEFEHVRAYASKSAEQAARIAGVLTLWPDLDATEVTAEAMGWGVALARYYLTEAKRLAETGSVSAATERAEALRKWLLESWPHPDVTPRDIVRFGPNRLREGQATRETLAVLEQNGWVVQLPEGTEVQGIRRKVAYRIVRPGGAV